MYNVAMKKAQSRATYTLLKWSLLIGLAGGLTFCDGEGKRSRPYIPEPVYDLETPYKIVPFLTSLGGPLLAQSVDLDGDGVTDSLDLDGDLIPEFIFELQSEEDATSKPAQLARDTEGELTAFTVAGDESGRVFQLNNPFNLDKVVHITNDEGQEGLFVLNGKRITGLDFTGDGLADYAPESLSEKLAFWAFLPPGPEEDCLTGQWYSHTWSFSYGSDEEGNKSSIEARRIFISLNFKVDGTIEILSSYDDGNAVFFGGDWDIAGPLIRITYRTVGIGLSENQAVDNAEPVNTIRRVSFTGACSGDSYAQSSFTSNPPDFFFSKDGIEPGLYSNIERQEIQNEEGVFSIDSVRTTDVFITEEGYVQFTENKREWIEDDGVTVPTDLQESREYEIWGNYSGDAISVQRDCTETYEKCLPMKSFPYIRIGPFYSFTTGYRRSN